jgi:hypothetical protein
VIEPPKWTKDQLESDREQAIEIFRKSRIEEPLEDYLEAFDEYRMHVEELLETTVDLSDFETAGLEVLSDKHMLSAFRYLAAPPISMDDLLVLAEVKSLAKKVLEKNPERIERVIEVVKAILDRRRFTWLIEKREPAESEREAAIVASAALMAASKVQTKRRTVGKEQQEAFVRENLVELGFKEVPTRKIENISFAPQPGEFCRESVLGTRKADIIIGLWDRRVMPIECKVSNSYLNSVKRLNNDAAQKAVVWQKDFGIRQVVPSAVISGVYNLRNLEDAQDRGLTLFWAHSLKPMLDWINQNILN